LLDALYSKEVLRKAGNITRTGRLENPNVTVFRASPVCGSRIRIDLNVEDGQVSDYAQEINACALGQSSAAIVAEHVIGKTAEELRALARTMRTMLLDGGPPPDGEWADLAVLASVHDHKARHGAVMLPFESIIDGLAQIAGEDGIAPDDQLTKNA